MVSQRTRLLMTLTLLRMRLMRKVTSLIRARTTTMMRTRLRRKLLPLLKVPSRCQKKVRMRMMRMKLNQPLQFTLLLCLLNLSRKTRHPLSRLEPRPKLKPRLPPSVLNHALLRHWVTMVSWSMSGVSPPFLNRFET